MTAQRSHEESLTVLDFSLGKITRNKIKKALNECSVASLVETKENEVTLYINSIKVGMYTIELRLPYDLDGSRLLKEFKDFEIAIYDCTDPKAKSIDLKRDPRFRSQEWVTYNFFGNFKIKHLVEAIFYCRRLDKLKAFL